MTRNKKTVPKADASEIVIQSFRELEQRKNEANKADIEWAHSALAMIELSPNVKFTQGNWTTILFRCNGVDAERNPEIYKLVSSRRAEKLFSFCGLDIEGEDVGISNKFISTRNFVRESVAFAIWWFNESVFVFDGREDPKSFKKTRVQCDRLSRRIKGTCAELEKLGKDYLDLVEKAHGWTLTEIAQVRRSAIEQMIGPVSQIENTLLPALGEYRRTFSERGISRNTALRYLILRLGDIFDKHQRWDDYANLIWHEERMATKRGKALSPRLRKMKEKFIWDNGSAIQCSQAKTVRGFVLGKKLDFIEAALEMTGSPPSRESVSQYLRKSRELIRGIRDAVPQDEVRKTASKILEKASS